MATISTPTWSLSPNPLSFPPKKILKPFIALSASSSSSPGEEPEATSSQAVPVTAGDGRRNGDQESKVPDSVKLALEKAREYKKKKQEAEPPTTTNSSGSQEMNVMSTKEGSQAKAVNKKVVRKISSIDFVGFGFSDKKRYREPPPGLVPAVEPPSVGEIPEVEIIMGDASKLEVTTPQPKSSKIGADNIDLYKPRVSTWGVFPRPNNISKTFGGGRVIQPGEVLETVEDKAAKEKRTKEMIAAYKKMRGLTIDAKTKSECEKALKEGDNLMDFGKLSEGLAYYEKVMKAVVFQSDLHGRAALQWSNCQDSLRRSDEARSMYEKLQSHPNAQVSKQAREFVFSFQAMEMMKVRNLSISKTTGYENYFEAFLENKANYSPTDEEASESVLGQALPYIIFLVSPILFVIFIAVNKFFSD